MSASTLSQQLLPANKLAVSCKLLLGLYLVIPLSVLVYVVDQYYWGNYLQSLLPSSPSHFILFQLLFGTPHIIASAIMLCTNRAYFQCYQSKLLLMSGLIIVVFGVGSLFIPYKVLYVTAACWTVYHVFKQQHGVAKAVCRLPAWGFYGLLWLSVSAGIAIYLGVFLKNSWDPQQAQGIKMIALLLVITLIFATACCQHYVATRLGKCFMWSNTLLIVSSFYMYSQQYYFLAILIPRLVHDATAYVFYLTHDYNKHHQVPQNTLFKYAKRCHLHVFVVLPLCSFGLAYLLQAYGDAWVNGITRFLFASEIRQAVTLGVIGYLSLMHYYTESFTWQAGSPLRKFIRFSL